MAKKKRNSRTIGSNWEREVGKFYLGKWTGLPWVRTPGSGGWNKKHAPSDLVPKEPRNWPLLIECKSYDDLQLHKLFDPTIWTMVDQWMEQMLEDEEAHGGKLLKLGMFKQKRTIILAGMFLEEAQLLNMSFTGGYMLRQTAYVEQYVLFQPVDLFSMPFPVVLETLLEAGYTR